MADSTNLFTVDPARVIEVLQELIACGLSPKHAAVFVHASRGAAMDKLAQFDINTEEQLRACIGAVEDAYEDCLKERGRDGAENEDLGRSS